MNDDDSGDAGDATALEASRLERLHHLELTPRRRALRRLAAANRTIIDRLVATSASIEQLNDAAEEMEHLSALLEALPGGQAYEGFHEAANAGAALSHTTSQSSMMLDNGLAADDPESYAFFDHSPFIGLANPLSPPIEMAYVDGRVIGTVTFGAAYEGPPGCVHGGYVAATFDEVLGATQSLSGSQGMTARLIVNYRSPTPLGTELRFEGRLDRIEGRKIFTEGTLHAGDTLCAEAEGLFISFEIGKFRALLEGRSDRIS